MEQKKVLLVEDDPGIREAITMFLQSEGFLVATATNGKEALDYLASNSRPNLVLLDNNMPVMCGIEFLFQKNQISEISSIPVIAVSAMIEQMRGIEGISAHVAKPAELEGLLRLIRAHAS